MQTECRAPFAPRGSLHPFRTLIADDHALFLSYVRQFLDAQALVQVVGTAANGSEALETAAALTPDLVLMDLHMPCMDGLQATAHLRLRLPDTRIIIMTLDETVGTRDAARAHGAHGFVGKSRIAGDLMTEIRHVFRLQRADDDRGAG